MPKPKPQAAKDVALAPPRDRLSPNEEEWILEDTFQLVRIDQTLQKVNMSRRQFSRYLKDFPDFAAKFKEAEIESCPFIENDMLNLYKKLDDHKMARVALEAMNKVLVFRNPSRYSQKIDVSVSQQISIRTAIDASNSRIQDMFRDVSATNIQIPADVSGLSDKDK